MSRPAARVGDLTATGDVVLPPGGLMVLIANQPAARASDLVSGAACVGAIALGSATVLIQGLPAARVGDQVTGANPATGVPVTTAIAPPGALNVLIGG
jgi:uncharacterized Zn-binding protein involved in type VI secretion